MIAQRFINIDYKHMQFALAAFEAGSFRQAGSRLRVRESTVSRRVHELEEAIGTPIFTRLSSGIRVTQEGLRFMKLAQEALAAFDAALKLQHDGSDIGLLSAASDRILFDGAWMMIRLNGRN